MEKIRAYHLVILKDTNGMGERFSDLSQKMIDVAETGKIVVTAIFTLLNHVVATLWWGGQELDINRRHIP